MNTSVSGIGSRIRSYVVLKFESGPIDASPKKLEVWGRWEREELAKANDWARLHGIASNRVKPLGSPESLQKELQLLLPVQSVGLENRVLHALVLTGIAEQGVIGPFFFPDEHHLSLSQQILVPGIGLQTCERLCPIYLHEHFPAQMTSTEVRSLSCPPGSSDRRLVTVK